MSYAKNSCSIRTILTNDHRLGGDLKDLKARAIPGIFHFWLVVWNHGILLTFHLGISSSQLTNSYFSEGVGIPPTRFNVGNPIPIIKLPFGDGLLLGYHMIKEPLRSPAK
jgi:hypothetical protein